MFKEAGIFLIFFTATVEISMDVKRKKARREMQLKLH